jgi:hypothetical protein
MGKGNRERKEGGAHRTWSGGTFSTTAPAVTMVAAVVASTAKRKKGSRGATGTDPGEASTSSPPATSTTPRSLLRSERKESGGNV